jgi:hypothetical protein
MKRNLGLLSPHGKSIRMRKERVLRKRDPTVEKKKRKKE